MAAQHEGHQAVISREEPERASHCLGRAQTEGGMVLAQLDEVLVVFESVGIAQGVVPVQLVDGVGRLKTVVHAFLVAQHLLAREHEGHALRGEHGRLCQEVEPLQFIGSDARNRRAQAVDETHVVVATHIGNHLRGFGGPRSVGVVDLLHIHLWMGDAAHDAIFQTLLLTGQACEESPLRVVAEGSAEGVADLVAESGDARHLRDIGLHAELVLRVSACASTPSLSIDEDGGVDLIHCLPYGVHRLNVVHAHEVETESVDVVLIDPILHRLDHERPHQRLFRSGLVSTARPVAVLSIGGLAIVVVGPGALEVAVFDVVGVVVDHVEDDPDACLVEGLHHLLELADAARGVVGVGGVAALRHIVVHGVIAPVVLIVGEPRLVYRTEVVGGQDMHGIDAQRFQVLDGPVLSQGEELARVFAAHAFDEKLPRVEVHVSGNGEVAVVHLVDDEVDRRLDHWALVAFPSVGIGGGHIYHEATLSVHAYCPGTDARSLNPLFLVARDVEGVVEAAPVATQGGYPPIIEGWQFFQSDGAYRLAALPFLVEAQHRFLGIRGCDEAELGFVGGGIVVTTVAYQGFLGH